MTIKDNQEYNAALQIVENTSQSLYLTGKAGTGKTTFLRQLKENTKKRMVVLAPTGIAAINAGGMTIHSFFHFPLGPYIPTIGFPGNEKRHARFTREKIRLIKTIDLLVIDEVSMVRADLLDAIDAILRRFRNHSMPFGGVQLLLIGDLQQLSPVVKASESELLRPHYETPYFFSSQALSKINYLTIELQKVYRQTDSHFLNILGMIREGNVSPDLLNEINKRYIPKFIPDPGTEYIRLTTHNRLSEEINQRELDALPGEARTYSSTITGDFPELTFPTSSHLTLKPGAQVMFIRNDGEKGYYNGMMGTVVAMSDTTVSVRPAGRKDDIIVEQSVWENTKYALDEKTGEIKEEIIGMFKQLPLKTAWAITIHKSQGLTFDHAIIDASASFAHGQTYVALSRCRSLEGIVLERPIGISSVITDPIVENFTKSHLCKSPDNDLLNNLKRSYIIDCLDSLFGLMEVKSDFDVLFRIINEFLFRDYPILLNKYKTYDIELQELERISNNFSQQYRSISPSDPRLNERIIKGCQYFSDKLQQLIALIETTPSKCDNKAVSTRLDSARNTLMENVWIKKHIMDALISEKNFSAEIYLKLKSDATLRYDANKPHSKTNNSKKQTATTLPDDIVNPALYTALINWRRSEMAEQKVPAYVVAPNSALIWIAANMPRTVEELAKAPGIGKMKLRRYGDTLISIVEDYNYNNK